MQGRLILAAVLASVMGTGARAEGWCGYAARAKSIIECGYSSASECETAIGKDGVCFIDPDYALDTRRAPPTFHPIAAAAERRKGSGTHPSPAAAEARFARVSG